MVRKFKLIKEYPGSPKLGTEIFNDEVLKGHYYMYMNSIKTHLGTIEPYKYPEFWEKVVEKEYEILSLSLMKSIKHEIRDMTDYSDDYIKSLLACKGNSIYSVKRLLDGEVFTIGDKVSENVTGQNQNWNIFEFSLKDTRCFACGVNINNIQKVKEVLFTTEDEVEITDSKQEVYLVSLLYGITTEPIRTFKSRQFSQDNYKVFSTEKAAQNYIKLHKPVLSYNDVLEMFDVVNRNADWGIIGRNDFKDKLTELVKSKL